MSEEHKNITFHFGKEKRQSCGCTCCVWVGVNSGDNKDNFVNKSDGLRLKMISFMGVSICQTNVS